MTLIVAAVIGAALSAANGAFYASDGNPLYVAASICSGLMVLIQLAVFVRQGME